MDDSRRQRYEQLQEILQEALLRDYPNPERKGCPGEAVLRELAERPRPVRDEYWEHVTHCSPCYQEFLEFRTELHRREDRRSARLRWALVAAAVVLVAGLTAAFLLRSRPQQEIAQPPKPVVTPTPAPEPPIVASVFNMESSPTRGAEPINEPPVGEIQRLPRRRLALSVYLPLATEPGEYEFQLRRRKEENTPVVSYRGKAVMEDGLTVLRVAPDLSDVPPGVYVVALRRSGRKTWQYSKADVR